MAMTPRYTYAIAALRKRRAYLAGEIERAEEALAKQREALAALDATLRLFHPDADPEAIVAVRATHRCLLFHHGEQRRLCLEALRDAGGPMPTRLVIEYVMRAKNLRLDDRDFRPAIREQVRGALVRMARDGRVRKLVSEPEAWWELTEQLGLMRLTRTKVREFLGGRSGGG